MRKRLYESLNPNHSLDMLLQRPLFVPRFCRSNGSDLRGEDGFWKAFSNRYLGICHSSGLPIAPGVPVAWYPVTRQTHLLVGVAPGDGRFTAEGIAAADTAVTTWPMFAYVAAVYSRYCQAGGLAGPEEQTHSTVCHTLGAVAMTATQRGITVYLHEYDLEACWQ